MLRNRWTSDRFTRSAVFVPDRTRRVRANWFRLAPLLATVAAVGWIVMAPVGRAYAYSAESSKETQCALSREGAVIALRASLQPEEGAVVLAGTPVTFSDHSDFPVRFAVASSPALLSNPDIDSGMGVMAGESSHGAYTFTSEKAAATPGAVYWDASVSNANFPECVGFPSFSYTTSPRKLIVSPPTVTFLPPAPQTTGQAPVSVSIVRPSSFTIAHPTVKYDVHCTASCTGDTSYEFVSFRHYRRTERIVKVDLESRQVSLVATSGGDEQFVYQYTGHALQTLRHIIRGSDATELRITVEVFGERREAARVESTVLAPARSSVDRRRRKGRHRHTRLRRRRPGRHRNTKPR